MKNVFLFIVCGAKEHIDTLHFSLAYLQRFTQNEIWILTDSSRNEVPINHSHIIDIPTPPSFDHHQASIYLKTGVYQFVPTGNLYCYLDTDIIAFNSQVDSIFNEYLAPISFAPDHCLLHKFSAYAVNCGCQDRWLKDREKWETAIKKFDVPHQTEQLKEKRKKIQDHFEQLKKQPLQRFLTISKILLSYPRYRLHEDAFYVKKTKSWHDKEGNLLLYNVDWRRIQKETGFQFNIFSRKWLNQYKEDIWQDTCHHLGEFIYNKFKIKISNKKFQHWNGGVFLFDDKSHDFLKSWHEKTMEIFNDPSWKTRDQGTLIATIWEKKLENHPTLDKKWNLIADYNNPFLKWTNADCVQIGHKEWINPNFIHVYHHFGDTHWGFWNEMIEKLKSSEK